MVKQKFNVGDNVIASNDKSKELHEVLGFSYDGKEFSYKVSSREVDISKKEVVNGVSFYKEKELEMEKTK